MDKRGVGRSWVAVTAVAAAGCWNQLPPPAAPAQVVPIPPAELGVPPEGESTVLFDADHPALVSEVVARVEPVGGSTIARRICLTPCAAHLSRGIHQLQFQPSNGRGWAGDGVVQVGPAPVAYRYALGHRNPRLGARIAGWALFGAALGLTVAGVVNWSVGKVTVADSDAGLSDSSTRTLGQVETFVGVGLAAVALAVVLSHRPELQPGTGVQWELPGTAPPTEGAASTVSR